MKNQAGKLNLSRIERPTVNVLRFKQGNWSVVLWIPKFDCGLYHDCLRNIVERKTALRYGRKLARLTRADLTLEDYQAEEK